MQTLELGLTVNINFPDPRREEALTTVFQSLKFPRNYDGAGYNVTRLT